MIRNFEGFVEVEGPYDIYNFNHPGHSFLLHSANRPSRMLSISILYSHVSFPDPLSLFFRRRRRRVVVLYSYADFKWHFGPFLFYFYFV